MDLKKEDFLKILKNYTLGEYRQDQCINWVSENKIYILETTKGKYILKVLNKFNQKVIRNQLKLIDFLYLKKIPVVKIIKNRKRREITRYQGLTLLIQGRIEGFHPEKLNVPLVKNLAKNIGKMQKIILASKLSSSLKMNKLPHHLTSSNLNFNKLRMALIHGDLSEVNLLVKNNKLQAIIDWDDAHYAPITMEIAVFIAHHFIRSETIQPKMIQVFLKEYQKYVKLGEEEKQSVYPFIKYRLFRIVQWHEGRIKHLPQLREGLERSKARLVYFSNYPLDKFLELFN